MEFTSVLAGALLVVRVYYGADVAGGDVRAAEAEARTILQDAGIGTSWIDCSAPGTGAVEAIAPCAPPTGANEVVVRLVATSPVVVSEFAALAYSMVGGETAGPAVLATVFVDRVVSVAAHAGVDHPPLLGRVMAHEIGHLLLNTTRHTDHGLMRARWMPEDISREDSSEWRFVASDAASMRTALAERHRQLSVASYQSSEEQLTSDN